MILLIKNKAGSKTRILIGLFMSLMCCVIAVASPLRAAAEEVPQAPVSDVGATVAGMLAGGFASYAVTSWAAASLAGASAVVLGGVAIPVAIVIVVLGVVVAVGVSITVTQLAHCLNQYWETHQSEFQFFIDQCVEDFKLGLLTLKNGAVDIGANRLPYYYNWVKENIVGFFGERVPSSDISAAVDGCEILQPSYIFDHTPSGSEILANVTESYDHCNVTVDDLKDLSVNQSFTYSTGYITSVNPHTKIKVQLLGELELIKKTYYYTQWCTNHIKISDDLELSCRYYCGNDWSGVATNTYSTTYYFYVPFVYNNNNNCLFFANTKTGINNGEPGNSVLMVGLSPEEVHYYLNGDELAISSKIPYTKVGQKNISVVLPDGTEKTTFNGGIRELFYYLSVKSCSIKYTSRSNAAEVTEQSNTNITYTTVNNYYDGKSDVLRDASDVIGTKVESGEITDASTGTVSLGVSSLVGTLVDSVSLTNQIAITDVSSTAIDTAGETVIPENSLMTVAAALIVAGNNARAGLTEIYDKFPFDVIPRVREWLEVFIAEPEVLVLDFDLNNPLFDNPLHVHIDFSKYAYLAVVSNWIVLTSVAIGLLLSSKKALDFIG